MASSQNPSDRQSPTCQVALEFSFLREIISQELRNTSRIAELERLLWQAGATNQQERIAHNQLLKQHNELVVQHEQLAAQHRELQRAHIESLSIRQELMVELSNAEEAQKVAEEAAEAAKAIVGCREGHTPNLAEDEEYDDGNDV